MKWPVHHFSSNGVDIAYADVGAGEPILLIHGFGSNHVVNWQSTSWFDTLTSAGRRVIAMDVRGHGASAKLYDAAAYRPALMAEDAANSLNHRNPWFDTCLPWYRIRRCLAASTHNHHPCWNYNDTECMEYNIISSNQRWWLSGRTARKLSER